MLHLCVKDARKPQNVLSTTNNGLYIKFQHFVLLYQKISVNKSLHLLGLYRKLLILEPFQLNHAD